ncbi:MAG: glycine zipper 2TM domain-containing protein [Sulfuricaulis sp.]|uniref:glycine zipper 2TM domain-containing protein n=1 Tax=Sulfuricaulis sp. TaxID=2003553 RepID=UPI002600D2A8|nr:glycine zipper 2TM domain-containing protein [Sulfuricaulis sp.]MCR4346629.1 glycine zipper 2TM domain-containing protein [Sulfuricaulis sp.]
MRNLFLIGVTTALLLAGCAGGLGGGDYERMQTRGVQEVQMGVVESVREVKIEGTKSGVGTTAGAVVGGVAGSTIGHGKGSVVGSVLGAVAGGVAGSAVEEGTTKQKGVEITVKLDGGRMLAITQAADEKETFKAGERVRILSGSGVTRVTH